MTEKNEIAPDAEEVWPIRGTAPLQSPSQQHRRNPARVTSRPMQSSNKVFFRVNSDGRYTAQSWYFAAGYGDRYEVELEGGTRADSALRDRHDARSK